jgi:hypothetical protein
VLPLLRDCRGELLLQKFIVAFSKYKLLNKHVSGIVTHLERYYIKHEKLTPLTKAGLGHFKTLIYDEMLFHLTNAVGELMKMVRKFVVYNHCVFVTVQMFRYLVGSFLNEKLAYIHIAMIFFKT